MTFFAPAKKVTRWRAATAEALLSTTEKKRAKIKMDSRFRGNDVERREQSAALTKDSKESYPLARSDSGSFALHDEKESEDQNGRSWIPAFAGMTSETTREHGEQDQNGFPLPRE